MKIGVALTDEAPFYTDAGSTLIGMFGYQGQGDSSSGFMCTMYSSEQLDAFVDQKWKLARLFAIIYTLCALLVLIAMCVIACCQVPINVLRLVSGTSFLACVAGAFTFFMYGSRLTDDPFGGSFHAGSGMAIAGVLVSLATGFFLLQIPETSNEGNHTVAPPPEGYQTKRVGGDVETAQPYSGRNFPAPERQQASYQEPGEQAFQPGTETVTETMLPDGSKKVVTTTVNLDGSKSVSESVVATK